MRTAIRRFLGRLRASIPAGSSWLTASNLLTAIVQGVYFLILARVLGATQFGIFAGSLALASTFSAVAGIGAGQMLVMHTSRSRSAYRVQLGTSFIYVLITFLPLATLVISLGLISTHAVLFTLLPLTLSELLFTRIFDYGLQSFQAHERLRGNASFGASAAVLRLILVLLFLRFGGHTAISWAWLYAASSIAIAMAITAVCILQFGGPQLEKGSLYNTWRIGIYFSMGMASRTVYVDADKYLLVQFGFPADAGQFSVASRLMSMAFMPVQAMVYALNTRLFRAGQTGYHESWQHVRRVILPITIYASAAASTLVLCAPLIPRLLGRSYAESAQMLPLLSLILFSQSFLYLFGDALMGLGRQSWRSICQAVLAGASVAVNLWLIPIFGWRAAVGTAVGGSYALAITLILIFYVGSRREKRVGRVNPATVRDPDPQTACETDHFSGAD